MRQIGRQKHRYTETEANNPKDIESDRVEREQSRKWERTEVLPWDSLIESVLARRGGWYPVGGREGLLDVQAASWSIHFRQAPLGSLPDHTPDVDGDVLRMRTPY